ncbi:hypothetical protein FNJ88_11140 [Chryseobacterium sp. SNU WT5]|uniref:hypothetical protein n=1 Tax=Chryseobacterium sp. SNU WT5 TaxID=2594269 RepID=UPI00118032C4|nr:hypothetical protein [Chryseobacterium sp. SNU WT5]QDP86074.1 hypothetical protein FNJ88_11140 [Chryseobacterium sp. SNU WT5]
MKDLKIYLEEEELDYDIASGDFPVTIDYAFEDASDFQKKKGSEALDINLPGTLRNQQILNSFGTNAVVDVSADQKSKNIKPLRILAYGDEVFSGKAITKGAKKQHGRVTGFKINAFGGNSDWILALNDTTLYDLLKHISLDFTKQNIIDSWAYDGRNENMPFVFAPVKYAVPLDFEGGDDRIYSVENMKPSISPYWIIYWAFKSVGYSIRSEFFNTDYFRRLTMPWTWGAFLTSEGTKYDIHKIEAKSQYTYRIEGDLYQEIDFNVSKELADNNSTIPGGDYSYISPRMVWKYNTPHFGLLKSRFGIDISFDSLVDMGSYFYIYVNWFKNGVHIKEKLINYVKAPAFGRRADAGVVYDWFDVEINPNDTIECSIVVNSKETNTATVCRSNISVLSFKTEFFKIPEGGTVDFDNYLGLQKYKFLDFFKGIIDTCNLSFATHNAEKTVLIEPTHPYSLTNNLATVSGGYFNNQTLNWTNIEDVEKESEIILYSDAAREYVFKFKQDSSDGALKVVQDRNKILLGSSKYVFSERFKDKTEFENRFFSPTMHYFCNDFQDVTGISPQMVCLVPENISNTSSGEAQNIFEPKLCYYKGRVSGVGGWRLKDQKGVTETYTDFPYMFAVNYKPGGENDPCLSYTDERIGDSKSSPIAFGLMKRFFLQRLTIMNHGVWNYTNFKITNSHISNWFHREHITTDGIRWEIINVKAFNPLNNDSTSVTLRQWFPVSQRDIDFSFPSNDSVKSGKITSNSNSGFDMPYNQLICLYGDIPREIKD